MAIKSIKETIQSASPGWGAETEERLAYALERRERLLLRELGNTAAYTAMLAIAAEVESRINPASGIATQPSSSSVPRSTKPSPEKQPARDQSEDRKLPDFFVIAVDSPSGHPGRLLYGVWHRARNNRVSVWFESAWAADRAAEFFNNSPHDWASAAVTNSVVISNADAGRLFV